MKIKNDKEREQLLVKYRLKPNPSDIKDDNPMKNDEEEVQMKKKKKDDEDKQNEKKG